MVRILNEQWDLDRAPTRNVVYVICGHTKCKERLNFFRSKNYDKQHFIKAHPHSENCLERLPVNWDSSGRHAFDQNFNSSDENLDTNTLSTPYLPNASQLDNNQKSKRGRKPVRNASHYNTRLADHDSSKIDELTTQLNRSENDKSMLVKQLKQLKRKYAEDLKSRLTDVISSDIIEAANLIKLSSKIVVVCGAGLSTSSGLKDFRSNNGIFNDQRLKKYKLNHGKGFKAFELEYFKENPEPFYLITEPFCTEDFKPSFGHLFLRKIMNKLIRVYTQNIDELELSAGVESDKLNFVHGTMMQDWRCIESNCGKTYACDSIKNWFKKKREEINDKSVALIPRCLCANLIRPPIVFYGEDYSDAYYYQHKQDFKECGLLIIMGTKLISTPISTDTISNLNPNATILIINSEKIEGQSKISNDFKVIYLRGQIDQIVCKFVACMSDCD